jgi:hypothetical protein
LELLKGPQPPEPPSSASAEALLSQTNLTLTDTAGNAGVSKEAQGLFNKMQGVLGAGPLKIESFYGGFRDSDVTRGPKGELTIKDRDLLKGDVNRTFNPNGSLTVENAKTGEKTTYAKEKAQVVDGKTLQYPDGTQFTPNAQGAEIKIPKGPNVQVKTETGMAAQPEPARTGALSKKQDFPGQRMPPVPEAGEPGIAGKAAPESQPRPELKTLATKEEIGSKQAEIARTSAVSKAVADDMRNRDWPRDGMSRSLPLKKEQFAEFARNASTPEAKEGYAELLKNFDKVAESGGYIRRDGVDKFFEQKQSDQKEELIAGLLNSPNKLTPEARKTLETTLSGGTQFTGESAAQRINKMLEERGCQNRLVSGKSEPDPSSKGMYRYDNYAIRGPSGKIIDEFRTR